jgi:hypothetical protein
MHYMLPLEARLVGVGLNRYIDEKLYWAVLPGVAWENFP